METSSEAPTSTSNLTGDLTTGGFHERRFFAIDNDSGGTIGGSANIAINLSGQLATQSNTTFTINNSDGGMIGEMPR